MAAKKEIATTAPATNDIYTGMLGISLVALIVGCVLLYLDYSQYPDSKGPTVPKSPPVVTSAPKGEAASVAPPKENPANAEPAPKAEEQPEKK